MIRAFFLIVFYIFSILFVGADTIKVLSEEQFLFLVKNHHPVAQQAAIVEEKGERNVQQARGSFDPSIYTKFKEKEFANKEYFNLLDVGLKIPTWYGVEANAGFEQNKGVFLNPENSTPENGLWYAGVSLPIGNGLFIDKRRAILRKAQLYNQASSAERANMINNLYFEALKKYWKWVEVWNEYEVYKESVELARIRLNGVVIMHELGDKPSIDTLEAYIQLQTRLVSRNEYLLLYKQATLELSNYLWYENYIPLEITDSLKPPEFRTLDTKQVISMDSLNYYLNNIEAVHPEMQIYDFKLSAARIEERLGLENLKPRLNFNYNVLSESTREENFEGFFENNYKWGLEFEVPIFLRQGRGNLQLTRLEIRDIELNTSQKLLSLQNKVRSYYNEHITLEQQIELYSAIVYNYSTLLEGEKRKFFGGESSLFLINSREKNLISAQLKEIELTTKYFQARAGVLWAAGQLYIDPLW